LAQIVPRRGRSFEFRCCLDCYRSTGGGLGIIVDMPRLIWEGCTSAVQKIK